MPSIYANIIQSSALPKIPLTRRLLKKWITKEDEYTNFVANDTIGTSNHITKLDCIVEYIFKTYDDHIVLRRQIANELHIPKVSECIRIDHKLHVKLFFAGSSVPLTQWFRYGYNCYLTKKSMLGTFPSYLNSQGESFSSKSFSKYNSERI